MPRALVTEHRRGSPHDGGRVPDCTQASDELLALECRAGNESAFDAIVQRYERPLLRHCARITGSAAAPDAVQDAFLCAWNALRDGTEVRTLRPWLFAIAHRKALRQLAIQRRCSAELPDSLAADGSPVEHAGQAARLRATLAAVAELPADQRDALLATAVHGRSGRDIARELGVTEATVRQLVFRARASLRAAGAAALAPPLVLIRLLRRLAGGSRQALESAGGWGQAGAAKVAVATVIGVSAAGSVAAVGLLSGPAHRHHAPAPAANRHRAPTPAAPAATVTTAALPHVPAAAHHAAPRRARHTAVTDAPAHRRSSAAATANHGHAVLTSRHHHAAARPAAMQTAISNATSTTAATTAPRAASDTTSAAGTAGTVRRAASSGSSLATSAAGSLAGAVSSATHAADGLLAPVRSATSSLVSRTAQTVQSAAQTVQSLTQSLDTNVVAPVTAAAGSVVAAATAPVGDLTNTVAAAAGGATGATGPSVSAPLQSAGQAVSNTVQPVIVTGATAASGAVGVVQPVGGALLGHH